MMTRIEQGTATLTNRMATVKLLLVAAVEAVMVVLITAHVGGINGPWYWHWPWRRLGWAEIPLVLLAGTPILLAQRLWPRRRRAWPVLLMLMVATFAMELAAISQQRLQLARIGAIVENSVNTSYYTTAKVIYEQQEQGITLSEWLSNYPDLLQFMQVHAKYKPPGLVLYYLSILHVFGTGPMGQMFGGLLLGVLATLAVPATYHLIHQLGGDRDAAFCGASFLAACPSLVLFFPQFDQVYPTIAVAMVLCWTAALERNRIGWAVAYGALLALATFMSYVLLVYGFLLAVYTILFLARRGREGVAIVARSALSALAVPVLFYGVLWMGWGFDPIATLKAANLLQEKDLVPLMRPWPMHILWDIYDFSLGSGHISYLLVAMLLASGWSTLPREARRLVLLALSQIAVVAAAAFLPGEVARLWLLLYPLLMVPIGFELRRWPPQHRLGIYALLVLMTGVIARNMIFLNMGESHH